MFPPPILGSLASCFGVSVWCGIVCGPVSFPSVVPCRGASIQECPLWSGFVSFRCPVSRCVHTGAPARRGPLSCVAYRLTFYILLSLWGTRDRFRGVRKAPNRTFHRVTMARHTTSLEGGRSTGTLCDGVRASLGGGRWLPSPVCIHVYMYATRALPWRDRPVHVACVQETPKISPVNIILFKYCW